MGTLRAAMNRVLCLAGLLAIGGPALTAQRLTNWVAQSDPCDASTELLKHSHMEIGVWMNTSNRTLVAEFHRAMDFWAEVLDMSWHEQNTPQCSIQVVDGSPSLFANNAIAARSQFVDRRNFHGWIAFNPQCRLNGADLYVTAIHEIGHMLGLEHNLNPKSVMYFLNPEDPPLLDNEDLACLARRHKLRAPLAAANVKLREFSLGSRSRALTVPPPIQR